MKIIYISLVIITLLTSFLFYLHLCQVSKRYGKYISSNETTFPLIKPITMDFDKDVIKLSTGCNDIFGEYLINNNQIVIDNLGMTKKACEEVYMNLEFLLNQFISGKPEIKFDKDKIIFKGKDGSKFVFIKN